MLFNNDDIIENRGDFADLPIGTVVSTPVTSYTRHENGWRPAASEHDVFQSVTFDGCLRDRLVRFISYPVPSEGSSINASWQLRALPVGARIVGDNTHRWTKGETGWFRPDSDDGSALVPSTTVWADEHLRADEWFVIESNGQSEAGPITQVEADLAGMSAEDTFSKAAVDQLVADAVAAARAEERTEADRRFEQAIERINTTAREYAERADLCEQFEECMEELSDLGLKGRDKSYDVVIRVLVEHRATVRARDEDAAIEDVLRTTGFREDLDTQCYSEPVVVLSVDSSAEEAD